MTDNRRAPGWVVADGYDLDLALASVGLGWQQLVRRIFAALPLGVRVQQVKEKWGRLTVYHDAYYTEPEFQQVVADAEKASEHICEDCGEAGVLRTGGWLRTLCDKCANGKPPFVRRELR